MELFHVELVLSVPFIVLFLVIARFIRNQVLPDFIDRQRNWRDAELDDREVDLGWSLAPLAMGAIVLGSGSVMVMFGIQWRALILLTASLPIVTVGFGSILAGLTGGGRGEVSLEEARLEDAEIIQ